MGIKNAIMRAADKAGNAVATVSVLSSSQLDEVKKANGILVRKAESGRRASCRAHQSALGNCRR